jgi:large subunit ribosomal protein L22
MEIKATAKFIKISPRKVRLVASLVRGVKTSTADNQLKFLNKKATLPIRKLLLSAVANAVNNFDLDKDNLFVKEISVNEGPTLKRWMPRARGRATAIMKRTSHIDLILGEIKDSGEKKAKKQKIDEPIKLGKEPKKDDGVKIEDKKKKKADEAEESEKGKEIIDPRSQGKGKNTKIEGKGAKGFGGKFFRRKSG